MKFGGPAYVSIIYSYFFICIGRLLANAQAQVPDAYSVSAWNQWLGYDGKWSPITIRVGTPPQWVGVFVSTASQETWVIGPGGCSNDQTCKTLRGAIFDPKRSSTWNASSFYPLGLDPQLGFGEYGEYGYETVALGDQISVPSRVVGVVNTTEYWLGFFGLGIGTVTYDSTKKATFLSTMVQVGLAPSRSYGYTAGAYYRLKHVPTSLTLGGYDANRFQPHDVSFALSPSQAPVVALKEIKVSAKPIPGANLDPGWPGGSFSLLTVADAALYTIDSSTPYLWLPESVCLQFEKALGIVYDESVQLYTFGNNLLQHQNLVNWNLTFSFVIADEPNSPKMVSLSLPYAAFDLQLSYPFPGFNATQFSPPMNYFPLRKAANDSQFTIGRCFLQETYLMVDYEQGNFSVYQATFPTDTNLKLVNIPTPQDGNSTAGVAGASKDQSLSKSALAGIVVGAAAVVGALVIGVVWALRRRNRGSSDGEEEKPTAYKKKSWFARFSNWLFHTSKAEAVPEMHGSSTNVHEMTGTPVVPEMAATVPQELQGDEPEVPPYDASQRKIAAAVSPVDHNPKKPVELEHRTSTAGYYAPDGDTLPSPGLAPPYSANDVGRRNTQTTGVSSRSIRTSRESSRVSSPIVISPVTPNHVSPFMPSLAHIARHDPWRRGSDNDRTSISEQGTGVGDGDPVSPHSYAEDRVHLRGSPQRSPRRFSFEDQG